MQLFPGMLVGRPTDDVQGCQELLGVRNQK